MLKCGDGPGTRPPRSGTSLSSRPAMAGGSPTFSSTNGTPPPSTAQEGLCDTRASPGRVVAAALSPAHSWQCLEILWLSQLGRYWHLVGTGQDAPQHPPRHRAVPPVEKRLVLAPVRVPCACVCDDAREVKGGGAHASLCL